MRGPSACPLLGIGQGLATARTRARTPTTTFAVGVREYAWVRGTRQVTTFVYYPAKGASGGNPITNAPVADGVFPFCEFIHGFDSSCPRHRC